MLKVCPQCDRKYPEDIEFCAQDGMRLQELEDDVSDPLIGKVLDGRWVIEKCIGMGGMGAVYLGAQRSVDRKVAIKTLKPELSSSREFVDRFFREARVASKISHPNCVTILDFGQTADDTLYLAMEFLDGMELTERLKEGDLAAREIIEICIQISSALAAAHSSNIIHRDLKPDNIYLLSISDESVFIKVLDFGIAKVIGSDEKMTQTGQVFGTPEYMSPEQCRGEVLDGRSDLYSLGCIMYRMLAGRPPFQADTPMGVLVAHVSQQPQDVRELMTRDDIPEAFADLTMRLLSKHPGDRPGDAPAVRAELEAILPQTVTQASSAVSGDDATAADGGSPLAPSEDVPNPAEAQHRQKTSNPDSMTHLPEALAPAKKSKTVPIILGVLVFLVLGSGCIFGIYMAAQSASGSGSDSGIFASIFGDKNPTEALEAGEGSEDPSVEVAEPPEVAETPEVAEPVANADGELAAVAAQEAPADEAPDAAENPADAPLAASTKPEPDKSAPAAVAPAEKDKTSSSKAPAKTVVVNTDKVDIHPTKNPQKTEPSKSTGTAKKAPEKPAPPAAVGNIRRTNLSANGEACLEPDVDQVLRGANRQFLSCYSDILKANPEASGTVMMSWSITPEGGQLNPTVQVSEIEAMNSCMLGKLKRLRFAPALGGRCYVRVTYSFSP